MTKSLQRSDLRRMCITKVSKAQCECRRPEPPSSGNETNDENRLIEPCERHEWSNTRTNTGKPKERLASIEVSEVSQ